MLVCCYQRKNGVGVCGAEHSGHAGTGTYSHLFEYSFIMRGVFDIRKRWYFLLLAALLLLSPVLAAGTAQVHTVLTAQDVNPGEAFDVSLEIRGNPGLAGWKAELYWDAAALELEADSVKVSANFSSGTLLSNSEEPGKLTVIWFSVRDSYGSGPMLSFTLKAADDAEPGIYPVTVVFSESDTMNVAEEPVALTVTGAEISIIGKAFPDAPEPPTGEPELPIDEPADTEPEEMPELPDIMTQQPHLGFADVPETHWAYSWVTELAARGVVFGMDETHFAPDRLVTRAEFVTILARLSGADISAHRASAFDDVSEGSWYCPSVAWATETGITNGTGNRLFSPDEPVTREQAATMLFHLAGKLRIVLPETAEAAAFADADDVSLYARDAVSAMQRAGILIGVGNEQFAPKVKQNTGLV